MPESQPLAPQAQTVTPAPESVPAPAPAPTTAPTLSDLQSRLSKADSLLGAGQNREAAALLLETVEIHRDSAGAWDLLSVALTRLGDPAFAAIASEWAVRLQPAGATVRFNAGLAHYQAKLWDPAIVHLTEAVRLNQASEEPARLLARAEGARALMRNNGQELSAALARFPADPELQLMATEFALKRKDLDGDGVPEVLNLESDPSTVTNGRDGTVYLSLPKDQVGGRDSIGTFDLLGDQGDRFLLLKPWQKPQRLFHFDGVRLVEVEGLPGQASFVRTRNLRGFVVDEKGLPVEARFTWQDGALVKLDGPLFPLPAPLKDAVDLAMAVHSFADRAFATPALKQEVRQRINKLEPYALLFPKADGRLRLELWGQNERMAAARVTVDKEWRIESLTWE